MSWGHLALTKLTRQSLRMWSETERIWNLFTRIYWWNEPNWLRRLFHIFFLAFVRTVHTHCLTSALVSHFKLQLLIMICHHPSIDYPYPNDTSSLSVLKHFRISFISTRLRPQTPTTIHNVYFLMFRKSRKYTSNSTIINSHAFPLAFMSWRWWWFRSIAFRGYSSTLYYSDVSVMILCASGKRTTTNNSLWSINDLDSNVWK